MRIQAAIAMLATLLLGACGRLAFDPLDGDAGSELTITPAITRTNVNTTTAFVATGGEPPYTFRIASGAGELDVASGRFLGDAGGEDGMDDPPPPEEEDSLAAVYWLKATRDDRANAGAACRAASDAVRQSGISLGCAI